MCNRVPVCGRGTELLGWEQQDTLQQTGYIYVIVHNIGWVHTSLWEGHRAIGLGTVGHLAADWLYVIVHNIGWVRTSLWEGHRAIGLGTVGHLAADGVLLVGNHHTVRGHVGERRTPALHSF